MRPLPNQAVDHDGTDHATAVVEDLFATDYVRMVRLATVVTGTRAAGEEAVADAYLQMWRQRERVIDLDDPSGWLRRVVINKSISRRRRQATEIRLAELLRLSPRSAPSPDLPDRELWARVRKLPARQRDVVLLCVVADLSIDECARTLGCGPETVRTHYRRARARLREELIADGHR